MNAGVHAREEIKLGGGLVAVAGAAWERSELAGTNFAYTYSNAGAQSVSTVSTDRSFDNTAWELGLVWKLDRAWSLRGRVATAYGIPQVSNMFTLSSGAAGDNTALKPQRNLGYDAGIDWTPFAGVTVGVTGFYEFFTDELVTQSSPTPNRSFTFNAPASEHRGVEAAIDWRFGGGWRLTGAYTYNDQFYTDYSEQLGSGATFSSFDRAGQKIPGVSPNELLARAGYDVADGALKGWGAYAEYQWKDSFYVDNGNKLEAPGYGLVNLNIHYKGEHVLPDVEGVTFFAEVRNVFDKVYVASANNITNSLAAKGVENSGSVLAGTASGSIYVGAPRTFVSGIKVKF
jgi:iron complex outermembrane receptor protein